jgi:hypothetical protein
MRRHKILFLPTVRQILEAAENDCLLGKVSYEQLASADRRHTHCIRKNSSCKGRYHCAITTKQDHTYAFRHLLISTISPLILAIDSIPFHWSNRRD